MNLSQSDIDAIRQTVERTVSEKLDEKMRELKMELKPSYVKVSRLAAELDVHPRTVLRKMAECGIPKRNKNGTPHTKGKTIYVFRREWENGERLSERLARGAAV